MSTPFFLYGQKDTKAQRKKNEINFYNAAKVLSHEDKVIFFVFKLLLFLRVLWGGFNENVKNGGVGFCVLVSLWPLNYIIFYRSRN